MLNIEFVRSELECSAPINSRANTKTKTTNHNLKILFHRYTVFHVYSVRSLYRIHHSYNSHIYIYIQGV